jgi:TolB-like protein
MCGRSTSLARWRALVLGLVVALPAPASPQSADDVISRAASAIAERLEAGGRKTVAVVDFVDLQHEPTQLGRFLALQFESALVQNVKQVHVINRGRLRDLLREQKLGETGVVDQRTVAKYGRIAGIDSLVIGTLAPLGETIRLVLTVVDTTTGASVAASTFDVPRTSALIAIESGRVAGPSPGQSGKPPAPSVMSIVQHEMRFDLRECRREATNVQCQMTVTNLATKDQELLLGSYSRAMDERGDEYRVAFRSLGRVESRNPSAGVVNTLVSGVPMAARVSFAETDATVQKLTLLELRCNGFQVQFRDVAIGQ